MGMSTHVKGLRALDGKFSQMIEVKLACEKAGILYPQEVQTYFKGIAGESSDYLKENAREVDIGEAVSEFSGDYRNGYTVDITKLPEGVTEILFFNSY